ncbi:ATP-binding protein [Paraburkholderia sp. MM5477-R1]|uniref:ATP-binding protein n=1 Tax=Paraburkholderia sp. MM5477-R1 TaxID=2991062 RepID=UPI003D1AD044
MTSIRKHLPLRRLDVALAREIVRLRARYQLSLDEFRGLFISDEQVDALLARHGTASSDWASLPVREPHSAIDAIAARFRLDAIAIDVLLFALAPDVDPSYARIYAYLNDDVRRRWPTIDLAHRVFGDTAHAALAANGPLFRPALLLPLATEESRAPLPLREFAANPALCAHLFGAMVVSRRGLALEPPATADDCGPLASLGALISSGEAPVVAMTGTQPDTGFAAVGALARRLDRAVVRLTITADDDPSALLRDGALTARLADALLLIEADSIALQMLAPALRDIPVPVFLPVPVDAAWRHHLARMPLIEVGFAAPDGPARQGLWASTLQKAGLLTDSAALTDVAQRFRLSARQIEVAAQSLRLSLGLRPDERGSASASALLESARCQASVEFGGLAQRVKQTRGWENLVLPPTTLNQLRRLSGAIRYRERVFCEWGFDGGPGITALFSGSPGTGKSMSAEALAREAGLDLWRIDLSSMVSKYIGETEKHLDRVFALARDGNAILFFDEADALFGKRSEVKDAHDRYANIEVAYLLQRLEAFEGVVILASNLASNVDPAFSRRMHFVIEFPLPDASLRERLWRAAIPCGARVAGDVDFAFLARQFALAGGDIRVAVLDATFAAVADEAPIDMARLCQAVSRQLLKQGKVPLEGDFRQYQGLLAATQPRMAAQ